MRIDCLHGYFIFTENKVGEASDFMTISGLKLSKVGSFYTFETLADAQDYCLVGKALVGGHVATVTHEGPPWEIFEKNGVVYDFVKDLVVPINSITAKGFIRNAGNYFTASGLLIPGSIMDDGSRVKDYSTYFLDRRASWLYSEVSFVENT